MPLRTLAPPRPTSIPHRDSYVRFCPLAAELGLSKQNKMRELRWFERQDFLIMEIDRNRNPIIRLLPLSPARNRNDVAFELE